MTEPFLTQQSVEWRRDCRVDWTNALMVPGQLSGTTISSDLVQNRVIQLSGPLLQQLRYPNTAICVLVLMSTYTELAVWVMAVTEAHCRMTGAPESKRQVLVSWNSVSLGASSLGVVCLANQNPHD
ncbi:hypothetical protein CHARACLAT_033222 [Characodon lateralis]|uniref:Uncharacterized protein n=1 Tax=Characodon lateralis TaxID=208331 RepID=A0ABU7EPI8_9TELE|nr:hypothetical protein [Characodon lateralis]